MSGEWGWDPALSAMSQAHLPHSTHPPDMPLPVFSPPFPAQTFGFGVEFQISLLLKQPLGWHTSMRQCSLLTNWPALSS